MNSAKEKTGPLDCEDLVIGAGLSGLLTAHHLQKLGRSVKLVEAREEAGGSCSPIQTASGELPSTLRFIADDPAQLAAIRRMEEILNVSLLGERHQCRPLTVESGQLSDFLGFGDLNFAATHEFARFNSTYAYHLQVPPEEWVTRLKGMLAADTLQPRSEVTSLRVGGEQVMAAVINADKEIRAQRFFFCGDLSQLPRLVPQEGLAPRVHQKIAKARLWTVIGLHLRHNKPLDVPTELHFLYGTKADFEPIVGRFFIEEGRPPASLWQSVWPSELDEDTDHMGQVIKNMRKQIRRAYPDLFENLTQEKIVVHPRQWGSVDLGAKNGSMATAYENLVHLCPLQFDATHCIAAIQAATSFENPSANPDFVLPASEASC